GVSTANQNIELLNSVSTGSSGFTDPSTRFETVSTTPSTGYGLLGFGLNPSTPPGNQHPIISNIIQTPLSNNVSPSDVVSVSADIIDDAGVASVTLNWGTISGNLPYN